MYTNYLAGANDEPITGLAHAQEHMMFRGSKTIDASQFSDTTAITGGSYNADTQNEITQYFFEMPSQYLDIALNLERSRATGILDAQKDWDAERGAITQEVTRDNSGASYRLYVKMVASHLRRHAVRRRGLGHGRRVQENPSARPQALLCALVSPEQRDHGDRRRRRSGGDDRQGARAVRLDSRRAAAAAQERASRAAHAADAARQQLRSDHARDGRLPRARL